MQSTDDSALLRQYSENNSEAAFAAIVAQHVNLVYSVALRHVGNPHQAEEITQAVFIILAKKARELRHDKALSSWLFQATRLTAINFVRSETRRHRREQEAYVQTILNEPENEIWPRIAPLLDAAVAGLSEKDRRAVVLRFFEGKSMGEVGAALGANEGAARKRVNRAVEKLQRFFLKRGVTSTAASLAGAMAANSVQAAPVTLAKSVAGVAITKGAAASSSTLTIIQGTLKLMAWTKLKTAAIASVAIILAAGTGTVVVKQIIASPSIETVFQHPDEWHVLHAPPVLILRPSRYDGLEGSGNSGQNGSATKILIRGQSFVWILAAAYDFKPDRMILANDLPEGKFDLLFTLPNNGTELLRKEIEKQFALVGHHEKRTMNVLVLKAGDRARLQGMASKSSSNRISGKAAELTLVKRGMSDVADYLGLYLSVPVINETGLTGSYDLKIQWDANLTGPDLKSEIERALREQYGLELVPERRAVEMLVVEKLAK